MATSDSQEKQEESQPQGMLAYAAPNLTQPHRARQALKDAHDGKIPPLIGYFSCFASPAVTKVVGLLGADLVWIDWEHTPCNVETMTQMVHDVHYVSGGRSHAVVRVPGHDHAAIGWALDAGASIVVPQVDTVEQAQHIVSAAKFGAKINGRRSAPPARWLPGLTDQCIDPDKTFWENLNEQAAIIIQIETQEGVDNLDDILTAVGEHIDSVWLGTLDLGVSMSLKGAARNEPIWFETLAKYNATLKKHNKPSSGVVTGPPEVQEALAKGKHMMFSHVDSFALMAQMGDIQESKKKHTAQDFGKFMSENW